MDIHSFCQARTPPCLKLNIDIPAAHPYDVENLFKDTDNMKYSICVDAVFEGKDLGESLAGIKQLG